MGEVQVFDAHHLVPVVTIPAHDNPLTAMSFSRGGDKLATASDKGTVIRVFSMPEGNKASSAQNQSIQSNNNWSKTRLNSEQLPLKFNPR